MSEAYLGARIKDNDELLLLLTNGNTLIGKLIAADRYNLLLEMEDEDFGEYTISGKTLISKHSIMMVRKIKPKQES